MKLIPERILNVIEDLIDPKTHQLPTVSIFENSIHIVFTIEKSKQENYRELKDLIEERVSSLKEADNKKILVIFTDHKKTSEFQEKKPIFRGQFELPEIKNTVAIASGKGGVGKSTTTVNLAYALKDKGYRIGILDADLYGPSIPKMMGLSNESHMDQEDQMIPIEKDGIQIASMGFLVKEDTPIIWRGPILQKTIQQFLNKVKWSNIDILLIDLPPGTGDIQLTIIQKIQLSGAVVVSTPQDIALIDAKRAIGMFQKVDVPLLGIIENMSYFQCPHCSERSEIFSHGGAHKTADDLDVPFLAEVPLQLKIRELSDNAGQKELIQDSDIGLPYRQAAATLLEQLSF